MAQTMCRRWAICFGLVLVIALVSGCYGVLNHVDAPAAVPPTTAASPGKSGETVAATATTATPSSEAATGVDSSVVDGWTGTIVALDPMAQYDDYFLRQDGERYGIDGSGGGLTAQIESARQQGAAVQVWGHLLTGVPDVNGRQIVVERSSDGKRLGMSGNVPGEWKVWAVCGRVGRGPGGTVRTGERDIQHPGGAWNLPRRGSVFYLKERITLAPASLAHHRAHKGGGHGADSLGLGNPLGDRDSVLGKPCGRLRPSSDAGAGDGLTIAH